MYELGNSATWGQEPQLWRGVVCLGAEDLGRYWLLVRANVIQPTWVLLTASLTARVGNAAARQQPDAVPGGIYWASAPRGLNARRGLRLGSRVIQNNCVWALPEGSYSADRMVFYATITRRCSNLNSHMQQCFTAPDSTRNMLWRSSCAGEEFCPPWEGCWRAWGMQCVPAEKAATLW